MIYSNMPELYKGSEPFPYRPCGAKDGNGYEIPAAFMIDTKTGYCHIAVYQKDGTQVSDNGKGEVARAEYWAPLPIEFYPLEQSK